MLLIGMLKNERILKNQDLGRKNKDLASKIESSMQINYMIMNDQSLCKIINKTSLRIKTKYA